MSYMLVDGNSIGWASYHGPKLYADHKETQAIYHTLKTIRALREYYPTHKMMILWDWGRSIRAEDFPEYKMNRSSDVKKRPDLRESYNEQMDILRCMFESLGVDQVWANGFEADDLAGYFIRKVRKDSDIPVLLISGDRDWQQFAGRYKGITWIDNRKRETRIVTSDNFEHYTGFRNHEEFLEAKAMVGDASDNIPGVFGIGEKASKAIMKEYSAVDNMYQGWLKEGKEFKKGYLPPELSRYRTKINKMLGDKYWMDVFFRNYTLMDLCDDKWDDRMNKGLTGMRANKDLVEFRSIAADQQFASITMNINKWDIF